MLSWASAQVTVSGRRIKVNGVDYRINGVCYSPVAIGSSGGFDFSKIDQDISLMKGANINTIRTYAPITNTAVLDKFAANGIKVIIGFGYNNGGNYDILSGSFVNYINAYKNHSAILMWELGNEYNYHPEWFGGNLANWYTALNNAAATARANDANHPVSTAHGELPDSQARNACPNIQVWGMNVYRWDNPGTIYNDWAAVSTKPMYLSEAGADSFDKRIPAEDRTAQATAVTNIVTSVINNYSVCSGVTVFEFNDEWWKAGSPSVQNTGGSAPNSSGVPYDGSPDEEYWGIVDIYRNIKPAYTALKNAYATTICQPTAITPYLAINGGAWQNTTTATLAAGGRFELAPHPLSGGSWSWTGPGGFTANTRNFVRTSVTTAMSGAYVARYTNACGAISQITFSITVTGGVGVTTVYQDCNFGGAAVSLPVGDYNLAAMNSRGIGNEWISSLRVTTGYRVTLYENDNFTGASLVVSADNGCLVGAGWNDRTSSMRVASNGFSTTIQAENWLSMSGVQTETTRDPSGGNLNVGWIDAGDWMAYSVTIPATGTYRVIYRVATPNASRTLRLEKDNGATQLGTVAITNTGDWQTWTNVAHNVTLPAGTYTIGIATATGGFNFNYFTITSNLSARSNTHFESIEEAEERDAISAVSPNPVKDQLFITDSENVKHIKIYNIQGQEMISVEKPGSSISVQSLLPGLHIAILEKKDRSVKKVKILKE